MSVDLWEFDVQCACRVPRRPAFRVDRQVAETLFYRAQLKPAQRFGTYRCWRCKQVVTLRLGDLAPRRGSGPLSL